MSASPSEPQELDRPNRKDWFVRGMAVVQLVTTLAAVGATLWAVDLGAQLSAREKKSAAKEAGRVPPAGGIE